MMCFRWSIEPARLDIILHKSHFMIGASAAGISVPRTKIAGSIGEVSNAAAGEVGFPLFLKADVGHAGWNVVRRVNKESAQAGQYYAFGIANIPSRPTSGERGAWKDGCFVRSRQAGLLGALQRGEDISGSDLGLTCVREYMVDSRLDALVAPIGKLTGFHGLCGFDWIIDSSDEFAGGD